MATLEGTHVQAAGGRAVRYHVDYEVVGNAIHFHATFNGGKASHEGQFDFDPSKVKAKAAVDAFMQNHIEKSDWDIAP
jgi:hypothetical protein